MTPDDLIIPMDSSRADTEKRLKGIDPDAIIYPESGWRVKDIIAHLTAWEEAVTSSIQAWHWGEEFTLEEGMEDDEINELQYERRKNFPLDRVLVDWAEIREYFKTLIRETPPAKLDGVELMCPWHQTSTLPNLVKDMIKHEQEHLDDILRAVSS